METKFRLSKRLSNLDKKYCKENFIEPLSETTELIPDSLLPPYYNQSQLDELLSVRDDMGIIDKKYYE